LLKSKQCGAVRKKRATFLLQRMFLCKSVLAHFLPLGLGLANIKKFKILVFISKFRKEDNRKSLCCELLFKVKKKLKFPMDSLKITICWKCLKFLVILI
jgi:hypothetical protein